METILLIAHGTREGGGNDEAAAVARMLAQRAKRPVRLCFLEHAEPGIPDAIAALHAEGVRSLVALPLILTAAGHVKNDIPAAMALACGRFPGLQVTIAGHLGAHAALIALLAERFDAARSPSARSPSAKTPPAERERTGTVVIGRGAADPDANAEIYKVARLLWEARPVDHLGVGFMGVTRPTAAEAMDAAMRALGADAKQATRIIVIPYFLFQGLLLQKLAREAEALSRGRENVDIHVADPIGADAKLVETLLFRLEEHEDGVGHLNCGTCLYRLPLSGREAEVGGENAWRRSLAKAHLGGNT